MKGSRLQTTGLGLFIITANVLLVTLVAIAISERGFSGWWDTLRGEWENPLDSLEVDDPFPPEDLDHAGATTVPPVQGDDAVVTKAPAPAEPTQELEPPSVMERYRNGEDLTVLVLGDQTGTDANDWVGAWSRMLATDRLVELRTPTAADPTRYDPPYELGTGDAEVTLYNASLIGGTPGYAADRLPLLAPQNADLVLLNYGRSNTPDDLPAELEALWDALGKQLPDAETWVVVAPQRTDALAPTVQTTRDWAEDAEAPVVDVAEVFDDEGLTRTSVSTRDPLSVNIAGAERWAEIVHETVLGDLPRAPAAPQASPVPQQPRDVTPPEPEPPPVDVGSPPAAPPAQPPSPPANQPATPPPSQSPPYQPPPDPTSEPPPTPTPSPTLEPTPTPTPTPEPPPPPDPTEPSPPEPVDPDPGSDDSAR